MGTWTTPLGRRIVWIAVLGATAVVGDAALMEEADAFRSTQIQFELRLAESEPAVGLIPAIIVGSDRRIHLHGEPIITNADVWEARAVPGEEDAHYSIAVTFTREGTDRLRRATADHVNRPLAVLLNGRVVSAPTVQVPVGDGAVIPGKFTSQEATAIAASLTRRAQRPRARNSSPLARLRGWAKEPSSVCSLRNRRALCARLRSGTGAAAGRSFSRVDT